MLQDLGRRIRQARLAQDITQRDLAREAGVSKPSIERLEAGRSVQLTTLLRTLRALGLDHNVQALVPEAPASPLALLEQQGARRQRASSKLPERAPGPWTWGDE
ncbi:MAG: helix-turn-helix transcriptional regulator [Myxococcota bacterium]